MKKIILLIFLGFGSLLTHGQAVIGCKKGNTMNGDTLVEKYVHDFKIKYLKTGNEYKIKDNQIDCEQTISFLNQVFTTKIFRKYSSLRACNFQVIDRNGGLQLGVIDVKFDLPEDMHKCLKVISKNKSKYFMIEVSTRYAMIKKKDHLLFVLSETFGNKFLDDYMDALK